MNYRNLRKSILNQLQEDVIHSTTLIKFFFEQAKNNKNESIKEFLYYKKDHFNDYLTILGRQMAYICDFIGKDQTINIFQFPINKYLQNKNIFIKKIQSHSTFDFANHPNFLCSFQLKDMGCMMQEIHDSYPHFSEEEKTEIFLILIEQMKENPQYYLKDYNQNLDDLEHFSACINQTLHSLINECGSSCPNFPSDILEHDYQIKYAFYHYPSLFKTKMDIYNQMFLTLGGGYEWKENKLFSHSIEYSPKVDAISINRIPDGEINHIYPSINLDNNLVYMPSDASTEWQNAKKLFSENLIIFSEKLKNGSISNTQTINIEKLDELIAHLSNKKTAKLKT